MSLEQGGRPGDVRGFLHKKLLGLGLKFGAGAIGSVVGSLVKPKARSTIPRSETARPTLAGSAGKEFGRTLKFGEGPGLATTTFAAPGTRCDPPSRINPRTGRCETPTRGVGGAIARFLPGGKTGFEPRTTAFAGPVGDAVMGRYGAALQPGIMEIARSVCLRGMTLGDDGLCYNKSQISNKQRMWPRGRRPLLTGGDMRAIGIASRAGARLDRTTTRLRALGMMKQLPKPRKAAGHKHARPVAAVSVGSAHGSQ